MTATLIVFCRRPRPGIGKNRVAADIGADRTLRLSECLLDTALEDARQWPGPVVLAPADADDVAWAEALLDRPFRVVAQPEGNLGERISAVDRHLRQAGRTHLIFIGSDAPLLDEAFFGQAAAALESHDVVLGPADDGGVTLMGARTTWPKLSDLPWSSHRLGHELELACVKKGLSICSLDRRYDIDRASDLPRLYKDLENDPRPARQRLRLWLAESALGE
jgi:rSAM/selenodomain-associated transferase 1